MKGAFCLLVAIATGLFPLRTCFGHEDPAASCAPGEHGHEGHEGPDTGAKCCVDVPTETGAPWHGMQVDVPAERGFEPAGRHAGPAPEDAAATPRAERVRARVLLR